MLEDGIKMDRGEYLKSMMFFKLHNLLDEAMDVISEKIAEIATIKPIDSHKYCDLLGQKYALKHARDTSIVQEGMLRAREILEKHKEAIMFRVGEVLEKHIASVLSNEAIRNKKEEEANV